MTTGRINQVAHNWIVLRQRAQVLQKFFTTFTKTFTAIRKLQLEHVTHLTISNLSAVVRPVQCSNSKGNSTAPGPIFAQFRKQNLKKSTVPPRSFRDTLCIKLEKKKAALKRTIFNHSCISNKKINHCAHRSKCANGGQLHKKFQSVRAEDQKSSHPDTENKSSEPTQPKLEGRKQKKPDLNRTLQIEPRRFNR